MALNIVLLDDCEDLRLLGQQTFKIRLKANCATFGSFEELIGSAQLVLASDLIILDINLGNNMPTGLDAYDWLQQNHFKNPIFFLTGHANSHPLVKRALERGAQVLSKPISVSQLVLALDKAMESVEVVI